MRAKNGGFANVAFSEVILPREIVCVGGEEPYCPRRLGLSVVAQGIGSVGVRLSLSDNECGFPPSHFSFSSGSLELSMFSEVFSVENERAAANGWTEGRLWRRVLGM